MKILPLVSILAFSFAPLAYAADAPVKSEPPAPKATEPVIVSPEVMQADAKLTVLQTHMNVLLAQKEALEAQINAMQLRVDTAKSTKDKLSK